MLWQLCLKAVLGTCSSYVSNAQWIWALVICDCLLKKWRQNFTSKSIALRRQFQSPCCCRWLKFLLSKTDIYTGNTDICLYDFMVLVMQEPILTSTFVMHAYFTCIFCTSNKDACQKSYQAIARFWPINVNFLAEHRLHFLVFFV